MCRRNSKKLRSWPSSSGSSGRLTSELAKREQKARKVLGLDEHFASRTPALPTAKHVQLVEPGTVVMCPHMAVATIVEEPAYPPPPVDLLAPCADQLALPRA